MGRKINMATLRDALRQVNDGLLYIKVSIFKEHRLAGYPSDPIALFHDAISYCQLQPVDLTQSLVTHYGVSDDPITSRTLRASVDRPNGFCRKATPSTTTPCRTIASSI